MKALTLINADAMAVAILPEITTKRDAIVTTAKTILAVESQWDDGEAVDALRDIKRLLKSVEDSRQEVKKPVLELGRQIDNVAAKFITELTAENNRITTLRDGWQKEKDRLERERLDRIQREAEAHAKELQRLENERLESDRVARLERERLEREESARLAKERAEAVRIERERIEAERIAAKVKWDDENAAEIAESKAKELELQARLQCEAAAKAKVEADARQKAFEDRQAADTSAAKARLAAVVAPVHVAPVAVRTANSRVREVPKFEVLDAVKVLMKNPDLVTIEVNRAVVLAAIRGGMKECDGLRIWWETETGVRL